MWYCFLSSHLQHPQRKKDFSPFFADCRGTHPCLQRPDLVQEMAAQARAGESCSWCAEGARSAAAVLTRPLAAASCCPQRGEPHSSTRSSKPFRFSEKRGVTWLPCVWVPCIGMLQTCPTGPKKDLSQMVQSNLLHIPELSHIFSQCPASREAQIPLDSHGVKHLRKQH